MVNPMVNAIWIVLQWWIVSLMVYQWYLKGTNWVVDGKPNGEWSLNGISMVDCILNGISMVFDRYNLSGEW